MTTVVIVPAAGLGERMGADKALLDLHGTTAIERIAAPCRQAARWPTVCARRRRRCPPP